MYKIKYSEKGSYLDINEVFQNRFIMFFYHL